MRAGWFWRLLRFRLSDTLNRIHPGRKPCSHTLARSTRSTHGVDLAEHELLELVVQGQDTGTGNTTEDVLWASTKKEQMRGMSFDA